MLRLCHPDGKSLRAVTVNGKPHADFDPQKETIRIIADATKPTAVRASY